MYLDMDDIGNHAVVVLSLLFMITKLYAINSRAEICREGAY